MRVAHSLKLLLQMIFLDAVWLASRLHNAAGTRALGCLGTFRHDYRQENLVPRWAWEVLHAFGSTQSPKQQRSGSSKTFYCLLYSNIYRIHFERRKAPETAWEGTASPPHGCSSAFFTDRRTNTAESKASLSY